LGKPAEFDQPCFLRVEFQAEVRQPFPKCFQELLRFPPVLYAYAVRLRWDRLVSHDRPARPGDGALRPS